MKSIEKMTEKQILNLKDEDLEKLINLKMAQEGIKLLQRPSEPQLSEVPKPDIILYQIEGIEFYFKTRQAAEEAKDLFKDNKYIVGADYNYMSSEKVYHELAGLSKYDHEEREKMEIKEQDAYSIALYEEIKELLAANDKLNDAYKGGLEDYETEYKKSEYIREEINERYEEVCEKYRELDLMKSRYAEYLELANGNSKTALTFLKKAYTVNEETEAYITEEKIIAA